MSYAIVIQLTDGLGNQMFQYAAGRAISQSLGGELVLLPCSTNPHSTKDYRSILFTKARHTIGTLRPTTIYIQKTPWDSWSPSMFQGTDVLFVKKALFQYLPPIQPIIPFIRNEFLEELGPIREQMIRKYNLVNRRRAGFLHVRRGDYVQSPEGIVLDSDYYLQGIQHMSNRAVHWYVLSNDVAWCKSQIWLQGMQIVDEPDELITLAFMSLCEGGAIIANSTFSWWGAILSGTTHVVYPKKWWVFSVVQPQIFPSNWISISP